MKLSLRLQAAASTVALTITWTALHAAAQEVPSLDLKFGVLAGLSGDLAQSGQPWTEATRLAVEDLGKQVEVLGLFRQDQGRVRRRRGQPGQCPGRHRGRKETGRRQRRQCRRWRLLLVRDGRGRAVGIHTGADHRLHWWYRALDCRPQQDHRRNVDVAHGAAGLDPGTGCGEADRRFARRESNHQRRGAQRHLWGWAAGRLQAGLDGWRWQDRHGNGLQPRCTHPRHRGPADRLGQSRWLVPRLVLR